MSSTPAALLRTLWRTVDLDPPPARALDVVLPASVNPRADLVGGQRFGAFNCERRAAW
jgi:hypothetical protein